MEYLGAAWDSAPENFRLQPQSEPSQQLQILLERSSLAVSRGVPSPASESCRGFISPLRTDGYIKELGLVQPEDKAKGIIVWKVDALHKRKKFCGNAIRVAWSFITTFFTFFRFRLFMLNLIDVVVFVRLPQAVKKIIKSANTGSVMRWKAAEDGIQRSYFKQPAPFGNGIYFEYD